MDLGNIKGKVLSKSSPNIEFLERGVTRLPSSYIGGMKLTSLFLDIFYAFKTFFSNFFLVREVTFFQEICFSTPPKNRLGLGERAKRGESFFSSSLTWSNIVL